MQLNALLIYLHYVFIWLKQLIGEIIIILHIKNVKEDGQWKQFLHFRYHTFLWVPVKKHKQEQNHPRCTDNMQVDKSWKSISILNILNIKTSIYFFNI